jgi:hypothetical protein
MFERHLRAQGAPGGTPTPAPASLTIAAMRSPPPSNADLRVEVDHYLWYHTLELDAGVVTKAMFDHPPILDR